jgi:hypothetical protein
VKEDEGIAPLHSVPQRTVEGYVPIPISPELGWAVEPMMVPLFADLAKLLEKTTIPIANKLKQYAELQSSLLINIRQGLIFYLGAVRFIGRLQDLGLPVCRPELASAADRFCMVRESFNVNLALHYASLSDEQHFANAITTNDVPIGPEGRIFILTGPNQGAKRRICRGLVSSRYWRKWDVSFPAGKLRLAR